MVSTVASEQEGSGFNSRRQPFCVKFARFPFMCMRGFSSQQTALVRACYQKVKLEVISAVLTPRAHARPLEAVRPTLDGRVLETYRGDESERFQLMTEDRT